mmetsp:Transcript_20221/g.60298  ORF Transcript_20221/g.60298 Transcript_20221/m.60298 type:complete len:261 (-) Transcript_20221:595-1377(-)
MRLVGPPLLLVLAAARVYDGDLDRNLARIGFGRPLARRVRARSDGCAFETPPPGETRAKILRPAVLRYLERTSARARASDTWRAFARDTEPRRARFAPVLAAAAAPGRAVVATVLDAGSRVFLGNFLCDADRRGLAARRHLVAFALDDAAEAFARGAGVGCAAVRPPPVSGTWKNQTVRVASWAGANVGAGSYRAEGGVSWYKNALIYDVVAMGYDVLFQDTDIVWLRDPLPGLAAAARRWDLQAMPDPARDSTGARPEV